MNPFIKVLEALDSTTKLYNHQAESLAISCIYIYTLLSHQFILCLPSSQNKVHPEL